MSDQRKIAFIAGKITGEPNYKALFREKAMELIEKGYIPITSTMIPDGLSYGAYMRMGLAMIDECDELHLLSNFTDSPGTAQEIAYASDQSIPVIYPNHQA